MQYAPPLHSETRVPLAPPTFRVLSFNTLAGRQVLLSTHKHIAMWFILQHAPTSMLLCTLCIMPICAPLFVWTDYLATKDDALAAPQGWMYEYVTQADALLLSELLATDALAFAPA